MRAGSRKASKQEKPHPSRSKLHTTMTAVRWPENRATTGGTDRMHG